MAAYVVDASSEGEIDMWAVFLSLLNIFGGFSGLERTFRDCHGCMDVVTTFLKQDDNTHLLVAVFALMLAGGIVELALIGHRGISAKIKRHQVPRRRTTRRTKSKAKKD